MKSIIFEGGLGVIALIFGFLLGLNLFRGIFFDVWVLLRIILFTVPLLIFYFILKSLPFENLRKVDRLVFEFVREYMNGFSIWQIAAISLSAGLGEELLFRGLLQNGILIKSGFQELINNSTVDVLIWNRASFYSVIVVIFVSILFGAAHALTKTYFVIASIISIYFGVILLMTNNIIIPIAVHALYDFVVIVFIMWRVSDLKGT
ncbi:MAG: CPBP family intramembrane metalloprotease [Planctomycetaceae bacterium]|nr:CPBP family intramembrane metalloprotease [Planctomycetaceae bacterium]